MKKYTVLLLLPDYVAEQYGNETFLAHVEAESAAAAQAVAQEEACDDTRGPDGEDDYDNHHPADYSVLLVVEGHHQDVKEV